MKLEKLPIHKQLIKTIKETGFETVGELVKEYNIHGSEVINKSFPLLPNSHTEYKTRTIDRRNRGVKFRTKILPVLIELGYLPKLPTKEELQEITGEKLVRISEAANIISISTTNIYPLVGEGKVINKDFYFEALKDFLPDNPHTKYLFKKEKIKILKEKYSHTLTDIAKELGFNNDQLSWMLLQRLSEEELKEARLAPRNWNREWVVNNIEQIVLRARPTGIAVVSYEELLGDAHVRLVDEYLDYRTKNEGLEFDGIDYFKEKVIGKNRTIELIRSNLIRQLYKIKCARAGIKNYWEIVGRNHYRKLTDEEVKTVKEFRLDPRKFDESDAAALKEGLNTPQTKWQQIGSFKPFLYYLLMLEENKYFDLAEKHLYNPIENFNSQVERDKLFLMKRRIDKALKKEVGRKKPKAINPRGKVYASRKQINECFTIIFQNKVPMGYNGKKMKNPLKYSTQILLGFFTGIRPIELVDLEIDKHLDIETDPNHPEYGLLRKYRIEINGEDACFVRASAEDLRGWGRLWITEDISKGEYSPSPSYGTLLVPRLTEHLNDYLKQLYKQTLDKSLIGKGYLFRSNDRIPYKPYTTPNNMFTWIPRWKYAFSSFLTEVEIKNFSYYETRHTVNNLIVNKTLIGDKQINEWKGRIAEVHVRHAMENNSDEINTYTRSETNRKHYQEEIPLRIYYLGLKSALDFPFDIVELRKWEKSIIHPQFGTSQQPKL